MSSLLTRVRGHLAGAGQGRAVAQALGAGVLVLLLARFWPGAGSPAARMVYGIGAFLLAAAFHFWSGRTLPGLLLALGTAQSALSSRERELAAASVRERELTATQLAMNELLAQLHQTMNGVAAGTQAMSLCSAGFSQSAAQIGANAEAIRRRAVNVSAESAQASQRLNGMAGASAEMSTSVGMISGAIGEMSTSLNEVAKNCQRESVVAANANDQSVNTRQLMESLGASAQEIGKIVEMIGTIADRTNLLALNATIEAASAGDAGKGFAVVAGEVKALAKQTAQATEKIAKQVKEMQSSTSQAVKAISQITGLVEEINLLSQTISSAVEEQSVTINEIGRTVAGTQGTANELARNIQDSGQGLEAIAAASVELDTTAGATALEVETLGSGTGELARLLRELRQLIDHLQLPEPGTV